MSEQDFKLIGELLSDSLRELGVEKKLDETRAIQAWNTLFGDTIKKYVNKIYVKNEILYLEVTSSLLKQNLLFQKDLFVAKINQSVGVSILKDIYFI